MVLPPRTKSIKWWNFCESRIGTLKAAAQLRHFKTREETSSHTYEIALYAWSLGIPHMIVTSSPLSNPNLYSEEHIRQPLTNIRSSCAVAFLSARESTAILRER